jgi:RND superfamily putative drug exporter
VADSEPATEKLNAHGMADDTENADPTPPRRRAGGGVSAQDLLRREGRL